jgi:predicted transcriptional regulator
MIENFGNDKKSAVEAKTSAQKIAFAPLMFQAAKALRDFGILKLLLKSKQGCTVNEIAEQVKISTYGVTVLLEAGLSLEMVLVENGKYKITKTGYFIEKDELTNVNMNFVNDICYKGAFYLQESITAGKPAGLQNVFGEWKTIYEAMSELPDYARKSWFGFDHYYSDIAFEKVLPIVFESEPGKIIDFGGNTSKFAIACSRFNEKVKVTILDLPGQLETAKSNIDENGFADRIAMLPIDFLNNDEVFPEGFDTIWMSQFLDCFSEQEIVGILQRAAQKMDRNTELFILETFWDRQKFEASSYSLHATSLYFTCMANGNSRMYHSEDMKKLIVDAGLFVVDEFLDIGMGHTLLKCKRRFETK